MMWGARSQCRACSGWRGEAGESWLGGTGRGGGAWGGTWPQRGHGRAGTAPAAQACERAHSLPVQATCTLLSCILCSGLPALRTSTSAAWCRRYVRRHVGRTVRLRLTPEIRFIMDDSIERQDRVRCSPLYSARTALCGASAMLCADCPPHGICLMRVLQRAGHAGICQTRAGSRARRGEPARPLAARGALPPTRRQRPPTPAPGLCRWTSC